MITLFLLTIYSNSGDACWTANSYIPPVINPNIIDNVLLPPLPTKNFQLFEEYMKTLPWTNDVKGERWWPYWYCRSGYSQSPIDLQASTAIRDFAKEFIKYGPLVFKNYDVYMPAIAFNNGNTLQFISQADNAMDPMVTGGPLNHLYRLEQVHYHWPSEHAINGHKFPMEIHFVHIRNDLDVEKALETKDGLAILAIFWNIAVGWKAQFLNTSYFEYFKRLAKPGTQITQVELNIGALISTDHKNYFTYSGSLSSPYCQEAVTWIVFETPVFVPETLYRSFGYLGVLRNNFRSLQKLYNRKVYRTPYRAIMTPLLAETFSDLGRVMTGVVQNCSKNAYKVSRRIAKSGVQTIYKLREDNDEDDYLLNKRNEEIGKEAGIRIKKARTEKTRNKEIGYVGNQKPVKDETRHKDLEYKEPVNDIANINDLNNDGVEKDTTRSDWSSTSMGPEIVDSENQQNIDFESLVRIK